MSDYKKILKHVVNTCGIAFVSTLNTEGVPECRALDNGFNKGELSEKFELYFTSYTNSPKIEQIKKDKRSSVYCYIPDNMQSITLFGTLEIINDKAIKDKFWKEEFSRYYPKGKDDESYGIIKFTTNKYKYYTMAEGNYKKLEGSI